MTMAELKAAVEEQRTKFAENTGKMVVSGPGGPVTMTLIDAMLATMEEQERRIAVLEKGQGL